MNDSSKFDGYLEVDKSDLDDQLLHIPTQIREVSDAVVELDLEKDRLKFQLLKLDATFSEKLRSDTTTKITEERMKALVILNPQHQAVLKKYDEVRREHGMLSNVLEAMRYKSRALVKLVDLYCADYFTPDSGPSPAYRQKLKRGSG